MVPRSRSQVPRSSAKNRRQKPGTRNQERGTTLQLKASHVKLILFDVDGVLTDGRVIINGDGSESKAFSIRDGIAMVWAQRAGLKVGFLSARTSPTTPIRAAQLGITLVQNGADNKVTAYDRILAGQGMSDRDVAYMGDDVVDLGVLRRAGLAAAPSDSVSEVRAQVDWVSGSPGGGGAARELIELILKSQGRWHSVVSAYANEGVASGVTSK